MSRILQIARREFVSTAMTKAFIIGAFVIPGLSVLAIPLIIRLTMAAEAPKVVGTVAIVDQSGEAADLVSASMTPEAIAQRRGELPAQMQRQAEEAQDAGGGVGGVGGVAPGEALSPEALEQTGDAISAVQRLSSKIPELTPVVLDAATTDVEAQKQRLWEESAGSEGGPEARPLALVVIDADAVRRAEGEDAFGTFALYHRPKMDDRILDEIREGVRGAIREARYEAYGQDAAWLEALTTVRRPAVIEVTEQGERSSAAGIQMMLPFAFMILMMLSVMIGAQYLLTTTIEEKSSRVVEVLLSAVSPMQLMTGKVLGQLCVGLTMLVIYSGLGIGALVAFALTDLISPLSLVYLLVFFLLEYTMLAALTAAVGAAVNELREAQSLQGPIIMVVMIPYFLWLPLTRDPNAVWAQVLSFIPPLSPFVMMIRVTSTDPPPVWEVLASIGVAAVGCYVFLWLAAKVFRVGLLMYGKPPNFGTLLKWIRMA